MEKISQSFWLELEHSTVSQPLKRALTVDVVIVGAGVTGLTAAYLLKKSGLKVAVLERHRVGGGESSVTTAHLTQMTDLPLSKLIKNFGKDHAVAAWDAGSAAMEQIHEIIHAARISCDFEWVPGFYHAALEEDLNKAREELSQEAQLVTQHGFEARLIEDADGLAVPAMRLELQAKFHPLKYLYGLARALNREEQCIFENSEVTEFGSEKNGHWVAANGHKVHAKSVFIATHVPMQGEQGLLGATLFQTKIYPYTSYVIRAELSDPSMQPALLWDRSDPYYYMRIEKEQDKIFAIFGGEDCKTGQEESPQASFQKLAERLKKTVRVARVTHHWSGQVIETHDGLPFIGETSEGHLIGTGYSGNGYTFGTLAAMIAHDTIMKRPNPWKKLFDPGRKSILAGAYDYMKENVDYPYYMAKRFLTRGEKFSPKDLQPGEGGILLMSGKRVACCKDHDGKIHQLSPVCTHMGCLVRFNKAECTWDCPCHGSRFKANGEVLGGPAEEPLSKI
jgi:glycine/D-amino acid oxidase-like deaminating enzyme/nitrite reductase/ring-hydroxylating ferredoxin subunit